MRAVIKFLFLQGKAPKDIHAILTETLAFFRLGRAKEFSAALYEGQVDFEATGHQDFMYVRKPKFCSRI